MKKLRLIFALFPFLFFNQFLVLEAKFIDYIDVTNPLISYAISLATFSFAMHCIEKDMGIANCVVKVPETEQLFVVYSRERFAFMFEKVNVLKKTYACGSILCIIFLFYQSMS